MNGIKYQSRLLDYIIYVFLCFYLIVDSVAGILITMGFPNIGQLYKILIVIFMLVHIALQKYKSFFSISFLFSLLLLIILNSFFIFFSSLSQSLLIVFKIICGYIFYVYFIDYSDTSSIDKIMKINYIVFVLNILIGILGFGRSTYSEGMEEGIGTTGFFYAGNEVSYTFICLSFWFISNFRNKKIWAYIVTILLSIFIGTKACMLAALLLCFNDIIYSVRPKKRKYVLLLIIIFSIILCVCVSIFMTNHPLYKYISSKLKQQSVGDYPILNALLSGRITQLFKATNLYMENFSFNNFLFGMGYPGHLKRIEMDFFEIYLYFGIFLLVFEVFFYISLLYKAYACKDKKLFMFNLICIFLSFLAGHIVYSLMGGVFFAILNARNIEKKQIQEKIIYEQRIN